MKQKLSESMPCMERKYKFFQLLIKKGDENTKDEKFSLPTN